MESVKHAEKQMEWFKRIDPALPEDVLGAIRLELITAYRKGYELAVRNEFDVKGLDWGRERIDADLLLKIEAHRARLERDIEMIKADLIKEPDMRPGKASAQSLEHWLETTRGAAAGVSQVLNIIRNGDAYII